MMPTPVAARLFLVLGMIGPGLACRTLSEGERPVALVEVVVRNPPPQMLNPNIEGFCATGVDPMFVVFKEFPGAGIAEVTDVNVAALRTGRFDAQADTCALQVFLAWTPGSRYRSIATDADDWVTRCAESLQFFAAPPARHLIRFTLGEEDCELELVPVGGG